MLQRDYHIYHDGDHVGTISAISPSWAVSSFARNARTSGAGLTAIPAVRILYPRRFADTPLPNTTQLDEDE